MKDEKLKKLRKQLKYLNNAEIEKEIINYTDKINNNTDVKAIAKEIYLSKGINYQKLNLNVFNDLINNMTEILDNFKNNDKKVKVKMIVEVIYIILLLILIKVPFSLVRDIGYDYIKILTTNNIVNILWNFLFLLLYTITMVCALIVLIRNFKNNYKKNKLTL